MIRSLFWTAGGEIETNIPVAAYATKFQETEGLLWVDISAESKEVSAAILHETFRFHPLAVADVLEEIHVPKVDDWGAYLYIVVRAIGPEDQFDHPVATEEVDIFLGRNYLVTYHQQPVAALERIWKREQNGHRTQPKAAYHLLYHLLDEVVTDYILLTENMEEAIDDLEDQLFDNPEPIVLEQIFSLKRALLHLRRVIAPQREMVHKLARADYKIIAADAKMFFLDIHDHYLRLYDILESLRELTASALEIYLSVVNNRMNNVMKILTIITTLFMPISFLTGFFGMNFFQAVEIMDAWTGSVAFQLVLLAVILFPIGMLFWIRKQGWMS